MAVYTPAITALWESMGGLSEVDEKTDRYSAKRVAYNVWRIKYHTHPGRMPKFPSFNWKVVRSFRPNISYSCPFSNWRISYGRIGKRWKYNAGESIRPMVSCSTIHANSVEAMEPQILKSIASNEKMVSGEGLHLGYRDNRFDTW